MTSQPPRNVPEGPGRRSRSVPSSPPVGLSRAELRRRRGETPWPQEAPGSWDEVLVAWHEAAARDDVARDDVARDARPAEPERPSAGPRVPPPDWRQDLGAAPLHWSPSPERPVPRRRDVHDRLPWRDTGPIPGPISAPISAPIPGPISAPTPDPTPEAIPGPLSGPIVVPGLDPGSGAIAGLTSELIADRIAERIAERIVGPIADRIAIPAPDGLPRPDADRLVVPTDDAPAPQPRPPLPPSPDRAQVPKSVAPQRIPALQQQDTIFDRVTGQVNAPRPVRTRGRVDGGAPGPTASRAIPTDRPDRPRRRPVPSPERRPAAQAPRRPVRGQAQAAPEAPVRSQQRVGRERSGRGPSAMVRTIVVIGLVAALAASIDRVGHSTGSGSGVGVGAPAPVATAR